MSTRPDWLDGVELIATNDARAAIAAGEHPIAVVMAAVAMLEPGQAYRLITPFAPAPLLEKVRALGLQVWSEAIGPAEFHNVFARLEA